MTMFIDTSEVKSKRICSRQHLLSSRNRLHLRPKVTPPAFVTGKIFHDAMHNMYLGVSLEDTMKVVKSRMQSEADNALLAMIPGYFREVLHEDLDRFQVLDIEHRFTFKPTDREGNELDIGIVITGSIDMIAIERATRKLFGFEHKSAKTFRDPSYLWMDEQPRVYTEALKRYVVEYNKKHPTEDPITLGGIYINEVKKLLRDFKYKRSLCTYPADDMLNFMEMFYETCLEIKCASEFNDRGNPCPGYMSCQMCSYVSICSTYMYSTINLEALLEEFVEEFEVRSEDHLAEDKGGLESKITQVRIEAGMLEAAVSAEEVTP